MRLSNGKLPGLWINFSYFKPCRSYCVILPTKTIVNIDVPLYSVYLLSFRRSTVDKHEQSGEDLAGSRHPLDHKRLELNLVCL